MTEAPFIMVMGMGLFTFVYCCVQFHIIRGKVTVYQGTTVFVKIYNSSEAWHQSVRPVCPFPRIICSSWKVCLLHFAQFWCAL